MNKHIAETLINDGWRSIDVNSGTRFEKHIVGFAPAGTVSDGTRLVTLTICPIGRWFARVDGWETIEREVDLRNFPNDPQGAIESVLTP